MSRLETLIALQQDETKAPIPVRLYKLWEHQHVADDLRPEFLKTAVDRYLSVDRNWSDRGMPFVARELRAALIEDDARVDRELARRNEDRQCQVQSNLQLAAKVAHLPAETLEQFPKNIRRHLLMNKHGWEMWESGAVQTPNYLDLLLADGDRLNELLNENDKL